MGKKISYRKLLQGLLIILAYGYLIYKLVTFNNYVACVEYFTQVGGKELILFVIALLLFPMNVFFESLKWRVLLKDIVPNMSIWEAMKQTYNGFVGAFLTPGRLGDYPSRVLLIQDKAKYVPAILMGFIGSLIMTIVILLVGICSAIVLYLRRDNSSLLFGELDDTKWLLMAFLLVLAGLVFLLFFPALSRRLITKINPQHHRLYSTLKYMGQLTLTRIIQIVGLSFGRYIIFAVQMMLLLLFWGIGTESLLQLSLLVAVYYLLITISPTLPAADIAIKGGWAIIVFSFLSENIPNITLATIFIWIINTILPMLVGTFADYKKKL